MLKEGRLKDWIERDGLYLIVIMFAFAACIFTIAHTNETINKCNQKWEAQLNQFQTPIYYIENKTQFNITKILEENNGNKSFN